MIVIPVSAEVRQRVTDAVVALRKHHEIEVTTRWHGGFVVDVTASPYDGPKTWTTVWLALYPIVGVHRINQTQQGVSTDGR